MGVSVGIEYDTADISFEAFALHHQLDDGLLGRTLLPRPAGPVSGLELVVTRSEHDTTCPWLSVVADLNFARLGVE